MLRMLKLRTILAIPVVSLPIALLGSVVDLEGVLFLPAAALAALLVSLTDPYGFGWTEHE